ncbi:hypothetical protein [Anaerophilus nitritogenes]|uniref:hypothetical protein n=1 Tax=Anaerophilus nitritogenes TaxID=2498136 RepID=UPI00101D0898|nr:hypothetical protein [Anaerophilus nitritogenes]
MKIIFIVLFSLCIIAIINKNNYSNYKYLYWNDQYYYITYEPVRDEEVGNFLGRVKNKNGFKKGLNKNGDSNFLDIDTRIFSLKKFSHNELCVEMLEDNIKNYYKIYLIKEVK